MGDTTDIKKGAVIRRGGELFVVINFQFTKPGKGIAFTKVKIKSISTGKHIEVTYKSGASVDTVEVTKQTLQYLYKNGDMFSFMNKETYETLDVDKDIVGEDAKYLKEGLDVIASIHEGQVVAIELPTKVKYTVKTSPPAVKGDTASGNVTKEIVLDNGLKVQAPIFIKEGEEVFVNTQTGEYSGRAGE